MGSWLVDCRGIAKKVRHATLSSVVTIKDCGAKRECPNCHYVIDNSDVIYEWPGLPIGVKFDPSDVELLDHLASKCGVGDAQPHKFIDEFIPTLETDKGICYTHPKRLPGATKDGTSIHFFHKTANAYASGQRKRRKIQTQDNEEDVRWHKTGKTKPIFDNGVQKGCKKIMVLYRSSYKGSKPVKSNWVMHQYHLGAEEDEKEGEYVVSKIYHQQQKHNEKIDDSVAVEPNHVAIQHGPKTPTPNPPRVGSALVFDDVIDDNMLSFNMENQDPEDSKVESCFPLSCSQYQENVKPQEYLAGESQAADPEPTNIDDTLLCKEIFSSCAPLDDGFAGGKMNLADGGYSGSCSFADLNNIDLDTLPDFQLADLQFGSQEDYFSWLDRL